MKHRGLVASHAVFCPRCVEASGRVVQEAVRGIMCQLATQYESEGLPRLAAKLREVASTVNCTAHEEEQ